MLALDHAEQAVDARDLAEDHAGLHRLARARPDYLFGRRDLDDGKLRRTRRQRARAKRHARRDDASQKHALGVDDLEVGRGAQIDDDRGRRVVGEQRGKIGHPIGPDLGGVPVLHADARLDAGPDGEGAAPGEAAQRLLPRCREIGDDARDDRIVHEVGIEGKRACGRRLVH